jgi:hypothetical protein
MKQRDQLRIGDAVMCFSPEAYKKIGTVRSISLTLDAVGSNTHYEVMFLTNNVYTPSYTRCIHETAVRKIDGSAECYELSANEKKLAAYSAMQEIAEMERRIKFLKEKLEEICEGDEE